MSQYLLRNGNKVIQKGILCFGTSPSKNCKPGLGCLKFCWCKRIYDKTPDVRKNLNNNDIFIDSDEFVPEINRRIIEEKCFGFRINEYGDFGRKEHYLKWVEIARSNPEVTFLAYTKRDDFLTLELLKLRPINFKMIWSHDKILGVNDPIPPKPEGYDKISIIRKVLTNGPIHCKGNCVECMKSSIEVLEHKEF